VSDGTLPSLAETVRLYRYDLVRGGTSSVQRDLGRRLHDLLVGPVESVLDDENELIVVPSGALGYLPFETLRDSTGTYLVERKRVRYAQSLTVLRQLQGRAYAGRERPLLALGGAAYEPDAAAQSSPVVAEARRGTTRVATRGHAATLLRDAGRRMKQGESPRRVYQQLGYRAWSDLPGTQSEVQRLGEMFGDAATIITGAGTSEDSVRTLDERNRLSAYRRLHFATHGVAVPEAPALSALVLSQVGASDSLAARDGYLTMEEIAGLDVRADVAVLSACQTGLGRIIAGEGVVSLSHAFLRAGANATLVSQWKVLDESTRQFMTAVYEKAKAEDTSFAEAVTETKRAFIDGAHGEKNTDPLRWAPFVYYGRE
jgi:CHAT domain-containing protein